MKYSLDLTAYRCPLPLLMAKKALRNVSQGDELHLRLNQWASVRDFELLAAEMGFKLEQELESEKEVVAFRLRTSGDFL